MSSVSRFIRPRREWSGCDVPPVHPIRASTTRAVIVHSGKLHFLRVVATRLRILHRRRVYNVKVRGIRWRIYIGIFLCIPYWRYTSLFRRCLNNILKNNLELIGTKLRHENKCIIKIYFLIYDSVFSLNFMIKVIYILEIINAVIFVVFMYGINN